VLSLAELRRAARVIDATLAGARIERVVQTDPAELVLELGGGGGRPASERAFVRLACGPRSGRVGQAARAPRAPETPPAFGQYLRAHLRGGRLRGASVRGDDRQLALHLETREGAFTLLLSLLGARGNLYLLDREDRLVRASRPLAGTRAELAPGEPYQDPSGGPPGEGEDRFAGVADEDFLRAVEARYRELEASRETEGLARRLAQVLRKRRQTLERKRGRLEQDVAAGEEAPRLERMGEILKAHLREARPGETRLVAPDFETGEPVEIPLDPTLDARGNLERLFKRARKATRGAAKAGMELAELEAALARLAEHEGALAAAGDDAEALEALAARPEVARLLERSGAQPPAAAPTRAPARVWRIGRRELPTRLVPKRYRTSDGLEVWVGKTDEGNDLLTTKLARGNDLFLHLEGSPGSHVVLRTEGRPDPPQPSLLEACELAVHFSKAREAGRASVHVAAIKDVSKPKGAKPGLVYVHRGRTVSLRRDPKRLQRILEARIEE
jgi:predicted ribosome quality control (RQC) complex YloA/Tae2 family protein